MQNKRILLFLLQGLLFGHAFAAEDGAPLAGKHLEQNEVISMELDGDSVKIYNDLIAKENYDSRYGPNVAGMVVGGIFIGVGTFFSVGALYAVSENDWASSLAGAGIFLISLPFHLVGIPVFLYNTYKFVVRKGHANRRDEYIDAFKRYKAKRESGSVEWLLVPSMDLANAGGGLNLLVAF